MIRLVTLLILAAALVLMVSPAARAWLRRRLPALLIYGGAGLALLLVLTGRAHWLLAAGGALLAVGRRLLPWALQLPGLVRLVQRLRGAATPGADAAGPSGKERRARAPGERMSEAEARETLGLGPEATEADIVAAHRRLMQRVHPDRGGSPALASRLNEAREVLLGPRNDRRAAS